MLRQKMGDLIENIPLCGPAFREMGRTIVRQRDARRLRGRTREEIFSEYYRENVWGDPQSRSGRGSSLASTAALQGVLPRVWRELGVRVLIDIPCGDFAWMHTLDLSGLTYIGADIVPDVVARNNEQYGRSGLSFVCLDLVTGPLPESDMVFCRDCLVHLAFADIARALATIRASGATYLMATHFPDTRRNQDIATGQWRPLNLTEAPFHFPPPVELIPECSDLSAATKWPDKSLGIWQVAALPIMDAR